MDIRSLGTLGSLMEITRRLILNFPESASFGNSLDGAGETLVSLGIVVLQADLKLNCLDKVALLLAVGLCQKFLDGASHAGH
jgi:hypothetical protein